MKLPHVSLGRSCSCSSPETERAADDAPLELFLEDSVVWWKGPGLWCQRPGFQYWQCYPPATWSGDLTRIPSVSTSAQINWVFVSVRGLSLVVASGGHSSSRCAGLSLSRPLLLRSTGSRCAGLVIVAHGPSCSVACGIFPDQGSNPCPLNWQADSQPLCHQGSPVYNFLISAYDSIWPAVPFGELTSGKHDSILCVCFFF